MGFGFVSGWLLKALAALVVVCLGLCPAVAQDQALSALDRALTGSLAEDRLPGLAIAVIENGEVVHLKGYGVSDRGQKSPVEPGTLFGIGEAGAGLTALGAMMLVEEGRLKLDTPLAALVPEVPVRNPFDQDHALRLVHLLEQTSGLRELTLGQRAVSTRGHALADTVQRFAPYRLESAPGAIRERSQVALLLAALMVERAGGQAYEDFIRARLFSPLDIQSAVFGDPGAGASGYGRDGETPLPPGPMSHRPGLNLHMSAQELAKVVQLLVNRGVNNGVALLQPQSIERLERMETGPALALGLPPADGLGLSGFVHEKTVFFGGRGTVGGTRAVWAYAPDLRAGYVVMTNALRPSQAPLLIERYLTRNLALPRRDTVEGDPVSSRNLEGLYAPHKPAMVLPGTESRVTVEAVEGGDLMIGGVLYAAVANGHYQRQDAAVPTAAFTMWKGRRALVLDGALLVRQPPQAAWTPAILFAAYSVLALFTLIRLTYWVYAGFVGRLAAQGGAGLRYVPVLALAGLTALWVFITYMQGLDEPVRLALFGRETYRSWGFYLGSLLVPFLGFLSFWRGLTAGYGASAVIRLYAMAVGILVLVVSAALAEHGLIGLMTWR
ncbi:MAG TPA: hypothetical protein DCL48_11710 [Alphaproteobacteria bacterium]|nr:hypothetical protein [Alphaproteobacteria bacterium]